MENFDKTAFLKDLADTWCKLAPSQIEGVGVFAIRDIPVGTHPFSMGKDDWVDMTESEVKSVPPGVLELIKIYCTFENGLYNLPKYGFKLWDTVDFLNHSKEPNVISIEHGEDFVTTKRIKKGEELLIDYVTIDEDVADYYKT
jgi:hypothetical protein